MIVWSGWGILTVVIVLLVGGPVAAISINALKAMQLYHLSGLGLVLGALAAAAVNWLVGKRLNNRPGKELVDKATGQTVILRRRHSLFFIPMQWWSLIMLAVALIGLYFTLFRSTPLVSG